MSARALSLSVRSVAVALALTMSAALLPTAVAQSVSPIISEYHGGAASGSFDLTNNSLRPLIVTLNPMSFSINRKGCGVFRKLDAGIQVMFSQTSLRLPPRSKRTIFYSASAETYPAWFSVYASFHGMPKQHGMNVELELPHTVYLLGNSRKSKARKGDLTFEDLKVVDGVLQGTVKNKSGKMLRVTYLDVSAPGDSKKMVPGFPLLPDGLHDFSVKLQKKKKDETMASNDELAKIVAHYGGVSMVTTVANQPQ